MPEAAELRKLKLLKSELGELAAQGARLCGGAAACAAWGRVPWGAADRQARLPALQPLLVCPHHHPPASSPPLAPHPTPSLMRFLSYPYTLHPADERKYKAVKRSLEREVLQVGVGVEGGKGGGGGLCVCVCSCACVCQWGMGGTTVCVDGQRYSAVLASQA